MRKPLHAVCACIGTALLFPTAGAATEQGAEAAFAQVQIYAVSLFIAVVILIGGAIYFMKSRDKRQTPVSRVVEEKKAIHSVDPSTPVAQCVRLMTAGKFGALVVLDGERLTGIFTERDALNKVLAGGLDPANTRVSEVMTKDPYCIRPTVTVGEAMEAVTRMRFRHLPVVDNGKVLAVVSSGDLTRWLIQDRMREIRDLVEFAGQS